MTNARIKALENALEWYAEQALLCRLAHFEGDAGIQSLSDDGGKRARVALTASQTAPDYDQPDMVTADDGHASGWPSDEPRQIVCTGEDGYDMWNCAFGTWSADDFGIDSDEPVGDGERLFVNRRLYDAAIARAIKAEATIAALDVQPLTVQDAARVPEIASLIEAAKGLNRIVEEIYGAMAHGCWLDTHGKRLKDTSEWVALYVALVAALRAIAEGSA